jgi:hypothetical protein
MNDTDLWGHLNVLILFRSSFSLYKIGKTPPRHLVVMSEDESNGSKWHFFTRLITQWAAERAGFPSECIWICIVPIYSLRQMSLSMSGDVCVHGWEAGLGRGTGCSHLCVESGRAGSYQGPGWDVALGSGFGKAGWKAGLFLYLNALIHKLNLHFYKPSWKLT